MFQADLLFQMPHESAVDPPTRDLSAPDLSAMLRNVSIKVGYTELTSYYCKYDYTLTNNPEKCTVLIS